MKIRHEKRVGTSLSASEPQARYAHLPADRTVVLWKDLVDFDTDVWRYAEGNVHGNAGQL
jgi:hypothetical protein